MMKCAAPRGLMLHRLVTLESPLPSAGWNHPPTPNNLDYSPPDIQALVSGPTKIWWGSVWLPASKQDPFKIQRSHFTSGCQRTIAPAGPQVLIKVVLDGLQL